MDTTQLERQGFALVPAFIAADECDAIIEMYDREDLFRKTIHMERYRFGAGEYKYFTYPLPGRIAEIRREIYPLLAPIASRWTGQALPANHDDFLAICRDHGQTEPTVLILKYGPGGHNTLHQDLYGEIYFPFQLVLFLNEPGVDYTGGEFVLTEQVPRAQTKANVWQPRKGDMLVFTTRFRPGPKGKVNVKHGVSPLHSGTRHTLGIIFHDAAS
jgi:hypothetical protein